MNPAYLGALAIYASPSIPLGAGWWRLVRTEHQGISTQLALIGDHRKPYVAHVGESLPCLVGAILRTSTKRNNRR